MVGHVLRLWWFLSPGLYSLSSLDNLKIFEKSNVLTTLANANPFAILFEAYRTVAHGMGSKPVVIRTFDLGADKQKEGLDGLSRVAPNPERRTIDRASGKFAGADRTSASPDRCNSRLR